MKHKKLLDKYNQSSKLSRDVRATVARLTDVAFNYIAPVDVEACTAAHKERRMMVNAAKRERKARRAA